jgi:signal transduction histidine kinase
MQGTFDPLIVALSVLVAMLAVFVALDLTGRVAAAGGAVRYAWVLAGAAATGVGMWTMHFTGMLALHLPIAVSYTLAGVGGALLIAIATSVMSLVVAGSLRAICFPVLIAGVVLGLGMGAMHVVAMGAMRMAAAPSFDMRLIAASMLIAVAAGLALVSIASRLRSEDTWHGWRQRVGASVVVGGMIAVMHYTAMAGTTFAAAAAMPITSSSQLVATHGLAYTAITSCMLMILLALGGAAVDRTLRRRLAATSEHARLRSEAEAARDAAQAANRAKSEFLAAMSHELRTPLNAISGYAELLEMGVHGPLNDKQREDVARIQRSQKHLLSLINDVLNFAKIEAGKLQLRPEPVRVHALLNGVEAMIAPQLQARNLAFRCDGDGPDLVAYCDADKAEQILLNLLSNAVKFTAPGGSVDVQASGDPTRVRIEVRDTGMGIPADKLEVIFEPFVQIERNLTRTAEGAGLGLAISRDLARSMGGDLTASSKLGVGSEFVLTLPRHSAATSARPENGSRNGRNPVARQLVE